MKSIEEEVNKIMEELKNKEEQKEAEIKVKIEKKWVPIMTITHEDYSIKFGVPFYIEINENTERGIKTLEIYGDYYAKKEINPNLKKALYYHIFRLRKPFFLTIPKGEMESNSGSHKVIDNVDIEENQIYQAVLKDFIKFPASMGLYKEDLEKLEKAGEQYIALIHYNMLFLLEDIKNYYNNEVQFNLANSFEKSGIAELKGEIPFKPVESTIFKGASIKANMSFKLLKSHTFIIIHNNNEETLKLWVGKREIEIPPNKAYYHLFF